MDGPCKLTPYDEWHGSPAFSQSEQDDVVLTGPGLKHLYLDVVAAELAEFKRKQKEAVDRRARNILGIDKEEK